MRFQQGDLVNLGALAYFAISVFREASKNAVLTRYHDYGRFLIK